MIIWLKRPNVETMHQFPSLVTALSLLVYLICTINVGSARQKHHIKPPAISGNEDFERVLRVQQNTVEQLIIFLPSLWLFTMFVSDLWAGIIGSAWVVGRILYAWGYYQAPNKRFIGFGFSSLSTMVLLAGSLIGISVNWLS